ncbi:hypothetical protein IDH10_00870 [Pelagibacterales bacterium SAG-MED20]|nr:hypothetical protein [Pelagibacterales bacterium SAG-MED20]
MKLKTFYNLFYRHRVKKASLSRKFFLLIIIPIKYFINFFYFEKKTNLDKFSIKNSFLFDKDINYLFEYFNSDKGENFTNQYTQPSKKNSNIITAHGYSKFYNEIFFNIKNEEINIMEIGSFYGNASAALFFYFKKANIYGADINPDMFKYRSKRIKTLYVDSSSNQSIKKKIVDLNISFKIIIEDASHMLKDQIISLFLLFPTVESGGYFIVEELDFPETREDMRLNQEFPDLKTILGNIVKNKDFNSPYIDEKSKNYFLKTFDYIKTFKGNMNEIAIIKKK